jgi:helicase-exonuclease AddAB AddA subunit
MSKRFKRTPDPQQEKAIKQIKENLYVTASAGSGKTGVLTDRFIHILNTDKTVNIEEIIAITFTEKAANEMKERILRKMLEHISELKAESTPNLTEIRRWNKLKNNFRFANISTIHSFCSKIIREHPIEVNINPDFEVVDELELKISLGKFIKDSVIELIEGKKPEEVYKQCENLVRIYGLGKTADFLLELMIREKEFEFLHRRSFERFQTKDDYLNTIKKAIEKKKKAYLRFVVSSGRFNQNIEYFMSKDFSKVKPKNEKTAEVLAFIELLVKLYHGKDVILPNTNNYYAWFQKSCLEPFKDDKDDVEVNLQKIYDFLPNELFAFDFSLSGLDSSFHLLRDLLGVYEFMRYKLYLSNYPLSDDVLFQRRNKSVLTFDELQMYAFELLANPENEEIREDIINSYKYIMVDECQDIDFIQNALIKLLAFSSQKHRPNLFIVGDGKQSIYKFRGADVSTFNLIMRDIDQMKGASANQTHTDTGIAENDYSLYTNYRSIKPVVDFTNSFFSRLMMDLPETFNIEYGHPINAFRKGDPKQLSEPSVEMILSIEPAENGWKQVYNRSTGSRTGEAGMVADRIAQLIKQKGVSPGRIAILMRSLNDAFFFERELYSRNIGYEVVEGKGFFNRKEIKDCLNLIKLIENPRDEIALLAVLRSPFFRISDLTLLLLSNDIDRYHEDSTNGEPKPHYYYAGKLYYRLNKYDKRIKNPEEREKLDFAKNMLERLRRNKDRMKITDLLNLALNESGYRNALHGMPQGKQKSANIKKLIEFVNQIEENKQLLLADFIEYMDSVAFSMESASDAPIPENTDSVTIMTVHKSKGLEFDYVFVPEMDKGVSYNRDSLLFDEPVFINRSDDPSNLSIGLAISYTDEDNEKTAKGKHSLGSTYLKSIDNLKEQLERKRLMYVAFTRAREHLVISAKIKINGLEKGEPKPTITASSFDKLKSEFIGWMLNYLGIDDGLLLDAFAHRLKNIKKDKHGNGFIDYVTDGLPVRVYYETGRTKVEKVKEQKESITPEITDITPTRKDNLNYITATSLITYNQCPRKYFYKFRKSIKETGEGIGAGKKHTSEEDLLHNPMTEQDDEKPDRSNLPLNMIGNIVHGLLEKYEDKTDFISIISSEINNQRLSALSDEKRKEHIINHINSIVEEFTDTDIYKQIQASKKTTPEFNHNEMKFSFKIDNTVIEGAIDKIYMDKDGKLAVLDYKTNRFRKKSPEGIAKEIKKKAERYAFQLKVYTIAASKILRRKVDKAQLYFLDVQKDYTEDMSGTSVDEIEKELGQLINEIQSKIDNGSGEKAFNTVPKKDNCCFCGYWMCEDREKGCKIS